MNSRSSTHTQLDVNEEDEWSSLLQKSARRSHARVKTVGTRPSDRRAGQLRRGVFINQHFVVASVARNPLRFGNKHGRHMREPIKQTFNRTCARVHASSARRRRRAQKCFDIRRAKKPFRAELTVIVL